MWLRLVQVHEENKQYESTQSCYSPQAQTGFRSGYCQMYYDASLHLYDYVTYLPSFVPCVASRICSEMRGAIL